MPCCPLHEERRDPLQKTDLVQRRLTSSTSVYERIVIEGPRFIGLRLTPAAYRHGSALAPPDALTARPESR